MMFVSHREHIWAIPRPVTAIAFNFCKKMVFVSHRKRIYAPPRPATEIALPFCMQMMLVPNRKPTVDIHGLLLESLYFTLYFIYNYILTIPDDTEMISRKICVDRDKKILQKWRQGKDKLRKKSRQLEYIRRRWQRQTERKRREWGPSGRMSLSRRK
jgi:hypothetical protein